MGLTPMEPGWASSQLAGLQGGGVNPRPLDPVDQRPCDGQGPYSESPPKGINLSVVGYLHFPDATKLLRFEGLKSGTIPA